MAAGSWPGRQERQCHEPEVIDQAIPSVFARHIMFDRAAAQSQVARERAVYNGEHGRGGALGIRMAELGMTFQQHQFEIQHVLVVRVPPDFGDHRIT